VLNVAWRNRSPGRCRALRAASDFIGGFPYTASAVTDWASLPDPAGANESEAGDLIRVLVVDDDPRVLQAIGHTVMLEADMVTVGEAADARTALSIAQHVRPSVALVDVLLPDEVTGLALVRALNQLPGCAVVAMSVRSGMRDASRAAGAVAFAEKGGDIDALLHAVRVAAAPRVA
jgi:CheY-like chemotaxis protein